MESEIVPPKPEIHSKVRFGIELAASIISSPQPLPLSLLHRFLYENNIYSRVGERVGEGMCISGDMYVREHL